MLKAACILIFLSLISGFCIDSYTLAMMAAGFCPESYTFAVMVDRAKKLEWKRYTGCPTMNVCDRSWALSNDRCLDLTYHVDGRIKAYRFRNFVIDDVWYGYLNPELSLQNAIAEEQRAMHKGGRH